MFKEVVLPCVLADRRKRQTESGIVIRAKILHMVIRPLLGDMARKRAAGHVERRLAFKRRQRLPPIHLHRILLIEVDVELLICHGSLCAIFF